MSDEAGVAAIVLAGGRGTRLGGEDKPRLLIAGMTLVDRTVAALRDVGCDPIHVVGPEIGGGPVAAIAAALPSIRTGGVMVWASDLARPDLAVRALVGTDARPDGAVLVDPDGREQWLSGVYRTAALRDALAQLGDPAGAPVRRLVGELDVARVPAGAAETVDIDTWEDYAHARRIAAKPNA